MFPWAHTRDHNPNSISIGSAVFAELTAEGPYILQWAAPSPQNYLFAWGSGLLSNTWFLWPTRVYNPNGISIGSAVFAGRTILTNRQTDRETTLYSVRNNRPHLYIVLRCGPSKRFVYIRFRHDTLYKDYKLQLNLH